MKKAVNLPLFFRSVTPDKLLFFNHPQGIPL